LNLITDIKNILLLGTDSRDPKADPGRSDSMMIMTIDKKHSKLKLTSIMRDSLVNIEGYGQQKLTHAHAYGGALLTLKTINQNYDMNIKDYIQVNFFGLEKIIDYIGGVKVNVTAAEIQVANSYIDEMSSIENKTPTHIIKAGLQDLNGIQAVGYSRIRYVGNSDFQRTERQRTVLTAVFKKLFSTNITSIPGVADAITPYIETSLKPDEMVSQATYILTHKMTNVEQSRVPYDDLYKGQVVKVLAVLVWDKEPTIKRMHQFIFE
jgi:polyisoprenyl-teichoic acid--peptidoglycan teichoic acid transferase